MAPDGRYLTYFVNNGTGGQLARFFAMDLTATSRRTRELLGWTPSGPTLSEDLAGGAYGLEAPA